MRNLIAELFMAMVAIAVMTLGVVAVKASIADGFQEIRAAVEERSLRRLLMSKLKGASPRDIRKVAMEALLWDVRSALDWLETRSMLPDVQRQAQIGQYRRNLAEQQEHYSAMLRDMTDRQVMELTKGEFQGRDIGWRRTFLQRSELLRATGGGSSTQSSPQD